MTITIILFMLNSIYLSKKLLENVYILHFIFETVTEMCLVYIRYIYMKELLIKSDLNLIYHLHITSTNYEGQIDLLFYLCFC